MLSTEHRAIVKATVPLLEAGGEALIRHFYSALLDGHPTLRPYFNETHQRSGQQQRALAQGVLAYARNIDELERLGPLAATIVNKHVALQIMPEHYPIVGGCLLASIREVLGAEVATDAVIEAWAAAYGQLADILIGAESTIYAETAARPGGWRGARRFVVLDRRRESQEIVSFVLGPVDGGAVVAHEPGQYIGLRLDIDGTEVRRNYSLSAASDGKGLRISVKRETGGKASTWLHAHLRIGGELDVFPPAGQFTLKAGARPVVFISGGVGITPTLPMLDAALAAQRRVHFIHAARHAGVHAFREHIDGLASRHPNLQRHYIYEQGDDQAETQPHATGLIDAAHLQRWLPANRDVDAYFLGPVAFMRAIKKHLVALGVPPSQVYYEFFGPAETLE
jgi:nitric oxide dioxygenase